VFSWHPCLHETRRRAKPLILKIERLTTMNYWSLLLIPYCTLAYGIHGGELLSSINRQVRNLICAVPFAVISWLSMHSVSLSLLAFLLSYLGTNLGFDWFPTTGWKYYGGLTIKGLITCPLGGFITLPLAYYIGYRTKYKNVLAEYLSGTFYGGILCALLILFTSAR
jgi:hypothetical protein